MSDHKKRAGFKGKAIGDLCREAYQEWRNDNAPTLGAALAFYTTFSLAPLLIIVIAVLGFVIGQDTVQAEILTRLQELIGPQGAHAVKVMIKALYPPGTGLIATAVAIGLILFGSTSAFVMLTQALNLMWGVKPNPKVDVWDIIKVRLLAFGMILVLGLILLLSLVLTASLVILGGFIEQLVSIPIALFRLVDFIFSLGLVTLLFALVYKVLPDVKIAWTDVWIGSALTAVLFTLGKFLLGLYFARSRTISAYGAAGALAVILLWVYYSAQILFLGAEFTKVYARRRQSPGEPQEPSNPANRLN